MLHERPYILELPNLLSASECERLRRKAAPHLRRQTFDNAAGRSRTSQGCVMRSDEVPTLRERFARIAGVAVSQLQPLKVSRYRAGERFDIHTDAIRGDLRDAEPDSADWWSDNARVRHGVPGAPFSGWCQQLGSSNLLLHLLSASECFLVLLGPSGSFCVLLCPSGSF